MFQLPHDSFSLRNSFLLTTAGTVAVGRSASYYTKLQSLRTLARPATSTGDGRTSHLPILLFLDLRCFSRLSFDVVLVCLVCRVPLVLLLVLRQWPRVAFWMRRAGPFALPCARTRGNQKSPPTSPLLRLTRSVGHSCPQRYCLSRREHNCSRWLREVCLTFLQIALQFQWISQ